MQPTIKEDRTGRGLASVATLVGVSYQHVKTVAGQLGIDLQDPQLWSDKTYVRKLFAHYGLSASGKTTTFKSWDNLPPVALSAIKWHRKKNCAFWHWVVFKEDGKVPWYLTPSENFAHIAAQILAASNQSGLS